MSVALKRIHLASPHMSAGVMSRSMYKKLLIRVDCALGANVNRFEEELAKK